MVDFNRFMPTKLKVGPSWAVLVRTSLSRFHHSKYHLPSAPRLSGEQGADQGGSSSLWLLSGCSYCSQQHWRNSFSSLKIHAQALSFPSTVLLNIRNHRDYSWALVDYSVIDAIRLTDVNCDKNGRLNRRTFPLVEFSPLFRYRHLKTFVKQSNITQYY